MEARDINVKIANISTYHLTQELTNKIDKSADRTEKSIDKINS